MERRAGGSPPLGGFRVKTCPKYWNILTKFGVEVDICDAEGTASSFFGLGNFYERSE